MLDPTAQERPAADPADRDAKLQRLLDELVSRLLAGERVSMSDYLAEAPELSSKLRELLPAAELLGLDKNARKAPTGDPGPSLAAPTLVAGKLGGYAIGRELGRGGMGVVYEAVDEGLSRPVALKVLAFHSLTDPTAIERFHREARAAASLQHRGIVPILHVGEERGIHFYAMQLIDGESLESILGALRDDSPSPAASASDSSSTSRTRVLATALLGDGFDRGDAGAGGGAPGGSQAAYWRSCARLIRDAAEAIAHANEQGIYHRDIKPSNLLVDRGGGVWIADFGLAMTSADDRLTRSGEVIGTLRYMAPERFEGNYDARSEVYSLGLTLYELLGKTTAFRQVDRADVFRAVRAGDIPSLRDSAPEVPFALEAIVHKAISLQPRERYASARELAADLTGYLDGTGVAPATLSRRRTRWLRAHSRWIAALAAGLTLCASAAGAFLWMAGVHQPHGVQHFAVADLNGDGRVEVVTGNGQSRSLSILERRGAELAVLRHFEVDENPFCVLPIRSGAGNPAGILVCGYGSRTISLLRSDGGGELAKAGVQSLEGAPNFAVRIGDLDGKALAAVATETGKIHTFRVEPGGALEAAGAVTLRAPPKVIAPVDLDGDGRMDLAASHGTDRATPWISLVPHLKSGQLGEASEVGGVTSSWGLRAGDLDGDGRADLAVAPMSSSEVFIILGAGGGKPRRPVAMAVEDRVQALALSDFDADAHADLAGAGGQAGYVCILRGRGDGTFQAPARLAAAGKGPSWIEAEDIDADGDVDLVVSNWVSDDIVIYANDATGGFTLAQRLALESIWKGLVRPRG